MRTANQAKLPNELLRVNRGEPVPGQAGGACSKTEATRKTGQTKRGLSSGTSNPLIGTGALISNALAGE